MEEEEAQAELEAVMAVYGDDCRVLQEFPPHIDVSIRPRTADDLAHQFVEAVLGLRTGVQYPVESPDIILVDSKGLDAERREKLTTIVRNKAGELSSRPMLIALCEEAVDVLTDMNHPEGNCLMCLDPLFQQDFDEQLCPFMKLMSCFHCFHRECILRWWNWVEQADEKIQRDQVTCPVCRKAFGLRDLEHILHMSENLDGQGFETAEEEDRSWALLHSDAENQRREKFEALLIVQREHGGLIEPKKDLVVTPGMFLPQQPSSAADGDGGGGGELLPQPAIGSTADGVISKPVGRRRVARRSSGAQSSRRQWIKKERR